MDSTTVLIVGTIVAIPIFLLFFFCLVESMSALSRTIRNFFTRSKLRQQQHQQHPQHQQPATSGTTLSVQPARAYIPYPHDQTIQEVHRVDSVDSLRTLVEIPVVQTYMYTTVPRSVYR